MHFDHSETQRMLLDSADRLIGSRASVEQWRARRDLPDGLDRAAWAQFGELGWLGLPIAEDAGGIGGSMEDVALLMIVLGRGLAVEPYVSSVVLGGYILGRVEVPRREAWLAGIIAGEVRVALAHAEAADRYEIETPRATRANAVQGGYVLSGRKMLVLDAPSADLLIVTARLDAEPGMALFAVEAARAGIAMESYPLIDGSRAADIVFDDVQLDDDALLAKGEAGRDLLAAAIDRANVALLGQAVGSMEACLDLCSAYLKERKQFGQPIGAFQSLQHLIVDMLIATHQSRSILYHALAHIEDDAFTRGQAVSAAKVVVGEAMQLVSRTGIQLHGGYGLTDEYAISHHFRRLMVLEKTYGDIEHHVRQLAA